MSRLPYSVRFRVGSLSEGVAMFRIIRVVLPLLVMAGFESQHATLAVEPTVGGGGGSSTATLSHGFGAHSQALESAYEVLVTINDRPIVEADVDLALRGGHDNGAVARRRSGVLENIIQQELARQRAVELGLDADSRYQAELHRMETQLNAFRRRGLSELYFRHEAARHAEVSDAEAKEFFEENSARIRTEFHIRQILVRKEERIEQALMEIKQEASFEEVARKQFPNLPKTAGEPWDLGYLRWTQVPKAWRSVVYGLKDGEVSGVIRGPNHRFWIIQLIDKREDPQITFESVKPIIVRYLKNSKIEALQESTYRDLRASARIVYAKTPPGVEDTDRVLSASRQSETPSE